MQLRIRQAEEVSSVTGEGCAELVTNARRTRVITAYAPCGDANSGESTVYSLRHKGLRTDPKSMFCNDLISALRICRNNDERLILMMDANEHVSDGKMCK